jgi:hypothetical protein
MTFPSGTISANDIRYQLAYNNTAGAQTPVTLNDAPVRAAADKLTGTVSYNDLRGKNVFFSGTITWGSSFSYPTYIYGYNHAYDPAGAGSVDTTSYYRKVSSSSPGVGTLNPIQSPNIIYEYNTDTGGSATSVQISTEIYPAPTSPYVNVYLDGTKYVLTASNYNSTGWTINNSDPLNLEFRVGQTNQVVITY